MIRNGKTGHRLWWTMYIRVTHPQEINCEDWDESTKQYRVDSAGLGSSEVEVQGYEAYGHMKELARNLMLVDECAPFSMYRDQA